jgi:hypothetical protein
LAGSYYFTVTDSNNCSAESNHINVFAYPYSPVSISVNGDTLRAYNALTYQWYLNGSIISGASSNIYIANQGGSYSVAITDSNGCSATSNAIVLTDINDLSNSFVSIFPNPFSTSVSISLQKQNLQQADLTVTDVLGSSVFKSAIQNPQFEINTSNWSAGVYFLQITADGERSVRQLIKQ